MTTSSEDVLMQVGQVRFKKGDGTLYLMSERIAWMLDNKDTVSVSHKYEDIKCKFCFFNQISSIEIQAFHEKLKNESFHFSPKDITGRKAENPVTSCSSRWHLVNVPFCK